MIPWKIWTENSLLILSEINLMHQKVEYIFQRLKMQSTLHKKYMLHQNAQPSLNLYSI